MPPLRTILGNSVEMKGAERAHKPANIPLNNIGSNYSYSDFKTKETSPGIIISNDHSQNPTLLKAKRFGRMGLTGGAVLFQGLAAVDLLRNSVKLFYSAFTGNSTTEVYESLGSAYKKSAIAGTLTGVANESSYWALGNLGMGIFSKYLDNVLGLASFALSDGLASIGMGQVKYRDKQNVFAVEHSIFNNPQFHFLKFLMPVEQSIISFVNRVRKFQFNRLKEDEPYAHFQSAGGGLALSGVVGLLAYPLTKVLKVSNSLSFLPVGLLSLYNNFALFRDGQKVNERAQKGGKPKTELSLMNIEGKSKMIASPLLAVNNFLLTLKGIGFDTPGNLLYDMAMGLRSLSVSIASVSFAAQSAVKFVKPDAFGPFAKRVVSIILNPKEVVKEIKLFLAEIESGRPVKHVSDRYQQLLDSDVDSKLFSDIEKTETFQSLHRKSQAGLPSTVAPTRAYLDRYNHSLKVGVVSKLIIESLIENTSDPELKKYLLKHERSFKIASYCHDIGHVYRSHLAEYGVEGHDNDELTEALLTKSDVVDAIKKHCSEELHMDKNSTDEFLEDIAKIIKFKSPLSPVLKLADFVEYIRGKGSDFNITNPAEFPSWDIEQIKSFADNLRLSKSDSGNFRIAVTEKAALEPLALYYDRQQFNNKYNSKEIVKARELAYLMGLKASDVSLKEVMKMRSESELDSKAFEGVAKLNGHVFSFNNRIVSGGTEAYCGWIEEKNAYDVISEDGTSRHIFDYGESILKRDNPLSYQRFKQMRESLQTPTELELRLEVVGSDRYKTLLNA